VIEATAKYGLKERLEILGAGFRALKAGMFSAATGRGYEGALRDRRRNRPATTLESHDRTLDHGGREALISEARSLEQNVGLVGAIADKYADGVVGRCELRWNTGDPEIDARYRDAWMGIQDGIDYRGEHDFCQMTKLVMSQGIFLEGDIFGQHMIQTGSSGRPTGYNVALIEADRIGSAVAGVTGQDTPSLIGGCYINKAGQVTGYQLRDRGPYGQFTNPRFIPASDMTHVKDTGRRVDSYRGVTRLKAVLDAIRDWKETTAAQVLSAKVHSKHAIINKVSSGGMQTTSFGGHPGADTRTNQRGNEESTVEEVGDQLISYMFPGEEKTVLNAQTPSDGWLNLMEMTVAHIARGCGLPFSVVWRMTGSGPAVRADMEEADRRFLSMHRLLVKSWYRPIGARAIRAQIDAGLLPDHPNWWKIGAKKPRKQSVDFGRDMAVGISLMDRGVLDEYDFCETWLDTDFVEVANASGRAAKLFADIAAREGVSRPEVRMLHANDGPPAEKEDDPKAEFDTLKAKFDAYGVGVRAGGITPQVSDETHFRTESNLPPLSPQAKAAWAKEDGIRRPITITPPPGAAKPMPGFGAKPAPATAPEDNDE
jgi:capsid protein